MNAASDPEVIARLRKEAQTAAVVRARTSYKFPHHVKVPGKRHPIASGWESHQRPLVAKVGA